MKLHRIHAHVLSRRLWRWLPKHVKDRFAEGIVHRYWIGPMFVKIMLRNG